jgi:hypothetical protein
MKVDGTEENQTEVWILIEVIFTSIIERKECQNDERKLAEKSRLRVKAIK